MRILHVSGAYVPSRRASSVAVMKMCEALARRGHEVIALVKAGDEVATDAFAFYGVEPNFRLVTLARPQVKGASAVLFAQQMHQLARRRRWADLVYSRDVVFASAALRLGFRVQYEAHEPPSTRVGQLAWASMVRSPNLVRINALTRQLQRELDARGGSARGPIVIAPSAANEVEPGPRTISRTEGRPIVGYVGSLYEGKGVDVVLETARLLPEVDFLIVGGRTNDIDRMRPKSPPNVRFVGFVKHAELGGYYRSLDVALLPNQADFVATPGGTVDISRWTSPLKMVEYMSCGLPIVASDVSVLREALNDGQNALLVPPKDVSGWAAAIRRMLDDPTLREALGAQARRDFLQRFTWEARARIVLEGLET